MGIFKYILIQIVALFVLTTDIQAQSVGINTQTPTAPLEIISSDIASKKTVEITNSNNVSLLTQLNDGKTGIGIQSPTVRLDLRNPARTNNMIGIGTTTLSASTVQGGALRYVPGEKELHYSDGSQWVVLQSSKPRVIVCAENQTVAGSFPNGITTHLSNWEEIVNQAPGSFVSGTFTAPHDGFYTFTFSIYFSEAVNTNPETYIVGAWYLLSEQGTTKQILRNMSTYVEGGNVVPGVQATASFKMLKNEKVMPFIWHNLGATRTLRLGSGFNTINIIGQ
ncbi:hypothetical protein [Dysgonomonas macrotermitis]|uniref:C1q domain-containing protein n=1 Tax=Dysgonomonas macrotermitis TaxID=1346286 RepID=A0A1M5CGS4_9BACT|nr:hypothetical protein [Dysgonomonas macrotermitis]SHF53880.1 hypothetical protein SAMN05444362_107164 [Dysgonomonas macrotermitis]